MKFLLCLLLLIIIEGTQSKVCNGTTATTLKKEIIRTGLIQPKDFSIDRDYHILYFNHGKNGNELAKLSLKINILTKFIDKMYSPRVHQKSHAVYMVSKNGVYTYHPLTDVTKQVGDKKFDLNAVYVRENGIFIVKKKPPQLNRLVDGKLRILGMLQNETIRHFVVDNKMNIFFVNRELKSFKKGGKVVTYKGTSINKLKYKSLAVDRFDDVYACTSSGIFKVDKVNHVLKNEHQGIPCMALDFDKGNNIIYSDGKSILKLRKVSKCIGIN